MAVTNTTPPMAAPGYGKRSAPAQAPRSARDFAHLPAREASIAAHIDRLPDGAAMDVKTLARELPAYGQQAIRTALANLSAAGHLRRVRQPLAEGRTQWVWRTHFSRTPRDDAWWSTYLSGHTPNECPPPPRPRPARTPAYTALARLGRADPRLSLSATECAALEPLAAEWLQRGTTEPDFLRILTAGLPALVHSPGAFTRKRLLDKMPPELPADLPPLSIPLHLMECTLCGTPGLPEALPGGLCRPCHGDRPTEPDPALAAEVRERVEGLRAVVRDCRWRGMGS
ncbi:hypothetical protein ACIHFE_01020 [Streptomyces sp. NPDC052396]|uniref:hypothetical protein n=1 Tax=Streptomyces sp. NPDC052396 TaxID=3365689 RepID=UPI0037D3E5F4